MACLVYNDTVMDDNEIIIMSRGAESTLFERKESWRADSGGPAICAFANDLADSKQPGVLLIGQNDNREYLGLTEAEVDQYLVRIPQIRDVISPFTVIDIREIKIEERALIAVIVNPSISPPVRYKGLIYIRSGASTHIAKREEEKALQRKHEQLVRTSGFFDQRSPQSPPHIDDLDWGIIQTEYLPSAVSRETLRQNNRSGEEQLASLRFLNAEHEPNHAAILCFHPDPRRYIPGAYIQFLRVDGTDLSDEGIDNMEMNGTIFHQLRQMNDKIKAHISAPFVIGKGGRNYFDYPYSAIEQAVYNAVMHREYDRTNAPARCYWFSDRIEIHSPGGCYGKISNEEFGMDDSEVDYRNPVVAEALKHMGFVDKFGAGIPKIKRTMSNNGNPAPIFKANDNYASIKLLRKQS